MLYDRIKVFIMNFSLISARFIVISNMDIAKYICNHNYLLRYKVVHPYECMDTRGLY